MNTSALRTALATYKQEYELSYAELCKTVGSVDDARAQIIPHVMRSWMKGRCNSAPIDSSVSNFLSSVRDKLQQKPQPLEYDVRQRVLALKQLSGASYGLLAFMLNTIDDDDEDSDEDSDEADEADGGVKEPMDLAGAF